MKLTAAHLMKGAWYALEQSGLLLRDAIKLHEAGAYASATALAMFGQEELGRYTILLGLWKRATAGEVVTRSSVRGACEDHVEKQTAGQRGLSLMGKHGTVLGDAMRVSSDASPGTHEYETAAKIVDDAVGRKRARKPSENHELRMNALYVGVGNTGSWSRPCELVSRTSSADAINDATANYRLCFHHKLRQNHHPDFAAALAAWKHHPELPLLGVAVT